MTDIHHPGVLVTVRFKSSLNPDEVKKRYEDRLPEFRAVPGILQKYYIYDPANEEWGGFYLFDSQASVDAYLSSDLRRSIADAYQIVGSPRLETADVVGVLRPERP